LDTESVKPADHQKVAFLIVKLPIVKIRAG
jgi:hypothetical protein